MADPITGGLAAISLVGTAGSTFMGMGAAQQRGQASADMYNYKAYMAAANAQIALQNRDYDLAVGDQQGFFNDLRNRQRLGAATADAGASGFDIGSSPTIKAGLDSVAQLGRYDTLQIINNARRKGQQDVVQSWNYTQEALMDQASARNALAGASIDETSSLIGGATSLASRWAGFQNQGVFS